MQIALKEVGKGIYYIDTQFIAVGVSAEFSTEPFLPLPKTSFSQSQFVYSGPILESKGMRAIFQKTGKIFENLGKNVQNLKII